jgi:hypothetical protein
VASAIVREIITVETGIRDLGNAYQEECVVKVVVVIRVPGSRLKVCNNVSDRRVVVSAGGKTGTASKARVIVWASGVVGTGVSHLVNNLHEEEFSIEIIIVVRVFAGRSKVIGSAVAVVSLCVLVSR